ncbi:MULTISPECIES: hypothetical protein [Pseudomonas]|jgi:hypothetical protein|nr:hypothetical protein [Pseudomonas mosselii]
MSDASYKLQAASFKQIGASPILPGARDFSCRLKREAWSWI